MPFLDHPIGSSSYGDHHHPIRRVNQAIYILEVRHITLKGDQDRTDHPTLLTFQALVKFVDLVLLMMYTAAPC